MEARLKEEARCRGVSFKEAPNTALRAGLPGGRSATRYVVPARSMGLRPNVNLDEALQLAAEMEDTGCSQPPALVVHPTIRNPHLLNGLFEPLGGGGNLTSDAHIAALAIECGGAVCLCDTDFARFAALGWENPWLPPRSAAGEAQAVRREPPLRPSRPLRCASASVCLRSAQAARFGVPFRAPDVHPPRIFGARLDTRVSAGAP